MKSYKTKTMISNIVIIPFVLSCFAFDGLLFSEVLNHMDQAAQEIGTVLLEIFIVVSFTTSIAYFLLNAFPKKISSSGTSFEMTFLCGNKICFQKEHVKVISMVDNGNCWNAVFFIKKRFVAIDSTTFPHFKELLYINK